MAARKEPETRSLTLTFAWALSDEEKGTLVGIVDAWAGRQTEAREGFPRQHARHVEPEERAQHYPYCDPEKHPEHEVPCARTDHDPLDCLDCGATIVAARSRQRVLVCGRLHPLAVLRVSACHPDCVVECGGSR